MTKPALRKMVCDPYVIVSVIAGVVLMALTVAFRVNPAEGSVVNEAVRGTWFHWVLMVTTMPAWIGGTMLGAILKFSVPLMFIVQIALYTGFGLLMRLVHRIFFTKRS